MALNVKENARTYILIGLVTLLLIAPFVFLAIRKSGQTKKAGSNGEYYDKNSGETISDPNGKTPENYGGNAEGPVYLGFSKLLDVGVSKFQLDAVKYAFEQFGQANNKTIREVSLTVDSLNVTPHDPKNSDSKDTAYFDVTLDRKENYKARVEYFDISAVRLYLTDPKTGKIVYDSKTIDRNSQDNYGGDGTPPENRP